MSPSRVFESRLDKMWNNQLMKFNYKEELCLWKDLDTEDSVLRPAYTDDDDNEYEERLTNPCLHIA